MVIDKLKKNAGMVVFASMSKNTSQEEISLILYLYSIATVYNLNIVYFTCYNKNNNNILF